MTEERKPRTIPTTKTIEAWRVDLVEREAAPATVEKYLRDVRAFVAFLAERNLDFSKSSAVAYKEHLVASYAPSSVNSIIAAINGFVLFARCPDLRLHRLKIQGGASEEKRWLGKAEYKQLIRAAKSRGDMKYALAIQTICSTGIRVSELAFVTAESIERGWIEVTNKGKSRRVCLPTKLRKRLRAYALQTKRRSGPIFVTRTGKPIDRTRLWRKLKEYALAAGIETARVFPHALRHLFATTFYRCCKDIDGLSTLLGHSRVETTRIYINSDAQTIRKQIESLGLVI